MTKTEIEDYIDAVIKHSFSMVEYSNFFKTEIKGLAEDTLDECNKKLLEYKNGFTKRKKKEVETDIQKILADLKSRVEDFVSEQLIEIVENEEKYLHDVVEKALGVKLVIPATAVGILSLVPIASAGSAEGFGENVSEKLGRIYDSVINRGYTFAEDYEGILDDCEGRFSAFGRGLDAEAGTLGYSLGEEFERIVFTKTDNPKLQYIWSAIFDTATCLACGMLDHKVFDKIEDVPMYPMHLNCVTGNTLISTSSRVSAIYRRWYKGSIYRIRMTSGNVLSITPNHPILTDHGFIPVKFLNVGDNIVCDNGLELFNIISKNKNNVYTPAEQLFSSFWKSSSVISCTMPLTSKDFHGDIINKEVDVINVDRNLGKEGDVIFFKKFHQNPLIFRNIRFLIKETTHSLLFKVFNALRLASNCVVRIFSQSRFLFRSCKLHSFNLLFSSVSLVDTISPKESHHFTSCTTKPFGNSCNTNSFIVKFHNFIHRKINSVINSSSVDTSRCYSVINRIDTDSKLTSYIFSCHSSQIKFDSIISIEVENFSGHVYNLETKDNFYIANGVLTHNCRCTVIPINDEIKQQEDAIPESYTEWLEKQSDKDKYKILGKKRFELYEQGMKIKQFVNNGKITPLKDLKNQ